MEINSIVKLGKVSIRWFDVVQKKTAHMMH